MKIDPFPMIMDGLHRWNRRREESKQNIGKACYEKIMVGSSLTQWKEDVKRDTRNILDIRNWITIARHRDERKR